MIADLDLLDGHRVGVDAQHAGRLARRRAQPAGELGEVVRRVQPLDGLLPVVAPDQVVPLRDQVAQRAALVAERDAAVHAAAGLLLQLLRRRTARRPRASPGCRTSTGRRSGSSRGVFRKPLGSATAHLLHHGLDRVAALGACLVLDVQDPAVVDRHDLAEPAPGRRCPSASSSSATARAGLLGVPAQDRRSASPRRPGPSGSMRDHLEVDPLRVPGPARRRCHRTCPRRSCARSARGRRRVRRSCTRSRGRPRPRRPASPPSCAPRTARPPGRAGRPRPQVAP